MQMVVGILVLVLIAVGVWWYMGSGTTEVPDTTTTADTTVVDDTVVEGDTMMEDGTEAAQ